MPFRKESQNHHPTIDDMLLELKQLIKTQNQAFAENFKQQTLVEEAPGSLAERSPPHRRPKEPPDQQPVMAPQRGWSLPPSVTNPPLGIKPWAVPRLRREPPRFDGENAQDWICEIQKYYNHQYTPLDDRLYLTQYLFDHPASDWREYWVETNKGKSWDDFLLAVEQRFDPKFYKPYAATTSPELFMWRGWTGLDRLKPNRPTVCLVANQEPNHQPPQCKEEVTQVSVVNQFGVLPRNASSNDFINGSDSNSMIYDGNMGMNTLYVDIVTKEHNGCNMGCFSVDINPIPFVLVTNGLLNPDRTRFYHASTLTSMVAVLAELKRSNRASDKLIDMYFPFLGFAGLAVLRGLFGHSERSTTIGRRPLLRKKRA